MSGPGAACSLCRKSVADRREFATGVERVYAFSLRADSNRNAAPTLTTRPRGMWCRYSVKAGCRGIPLFGVVGHGAINLTQNRTQNRNPVIPYSES